MKWKVDIRPLDLTVSWWAPRPHAPSWAYWRRHRRNPVDRRYLRVGRLQIRY